MTDPSGGAPNLPSSGTWQSPSAPPPTPEPVPAPPAAQPAPPAAGSYQAPPAGGSYQAPPAQSYGAPQGGGNWQAPPPGGMPGGFNPNMQQVAAEPGPAPGIAYADLTSRIIALVIDVLILLIPLLIVGVIGGVIPVVGSLIAAIASGAIVGGYYVYTWTTMRASYGQKFQKLETVSAADGSTLTQPVAIRRAAFLLGPSILVQILGGIPFLGLLSIPLSLVALGYDIYLLYSTTQSPKRQGFHDVQAGTVVIKHL